MVRLILVTGHQRSGTTLLGKLLFSHPDIVVTHEFSNLAFVNQPLPAYLRAMLTYTNDVSAQFGFVSDQTEKHRIRSQNMLLTLRYLYHVVRLTRGIVDLAVIEQAMHRTFPQTRLVGDKLPQYSKMLEQYVGNEQLICIGIYRDCRDVTSSFLMKTRTDWVGQTWIKKWDTAAKIAQRWVDRFEMMEKWANQMVIIQYEELVLNPTHVLADLSVKLGVDPGGFAVSMLNPMSIGNYRNRLTEDELKEIMTVAGPTMARLGYE
jgi:hypothetical protein